MLWAGIVHKHVIEVKTGSDSTLPMLHCAGSQDDSSKSNAYKHTDSWPPIAPQSSPPIAPQLKPPIAPQSNPKPSIVPRLAHLFLCSCNTPYMSRALVPLFMQHAMHATRCATRCATSHHRWHTDYKLTAWQYRVRDSVCRAWGFSRAVSTWAQCTISTWSWR